MKWSSFSKKYEYRVLYSRGAGDTLMREKRTQLMSFVLNHQIKDKSPDLPTYQEE